MRTHPASRTPAPITSPSKSPVSRAVKPAGRFLAELGGMCAVMCLGGMILSYASFAVAGWLGSANLARQAPEVSVLIIAVCLAAPMAAYMAARGHPRRHTLLMTGSTIGVGVVVMGLLWSGAIRASGLPTWHALFGLVCLPACALMIAQMLLSLGMYNGRAPSQGRAG